MMPPSENIFLIGYRGTGKTAVGRLLAEKLGWRFVDADEVLQQEDGRTIAEIFRLEGESVFRDKEAALLSRFCNEKRQVVACGGGAVLRAENRERLTVAGRVVWLSADATSIWQRLQNDPATASQRPALSSQGGYDEVRKLLAEREPLYRACATQVIDTSSRSPEDVVELITSSS